MENLTAVRFSIFLPFFNSLTNLFAFPTTNNKIKPAWMTANSWLIS